MKRHLPTLHQIEVFREVARAGSMTQAAENLYLSQSQVTTVVKDLEKLVSATLFLRTTRHLHLTESGRVLLEFSDTILSLLSDALGRIDEINSGLSGTLPVGCTRLFVAHIGEILNLLSESVPELKVQVLIGSHEHVVKNLLRGEIELALLTVDPALDHDLTSRELRRDDILLVTGNSNPVAIAGAMTLEELARAQIVLFKYPPFRIKIEQEFHRLGVHLQAVDEVSSLAVVRQRVVEHGWYGFIPEYVAREDLNAGRMTRINIPQLTLKMTYLVAYRRAAGLSPSARKFIECSSQVFQSATDTSASLPVALAEKPIDYLETG